jgi:hypothetical protein
MSIQTEIEKIPEGITNRYGLERDEKCIHVHAIQQRFYINIDFDDQFKVEESEYVIDLVNNKICVSLWKERNIIHVTVYN